MNIYTLFSSEYGLLIAISGGLLFFILSFAGLLRFNYILTKDNLEKPRFLQKITQQKAF